MENPFSFLCSIISDYADLSIRLASLDASNYHEAFLVFKAQCLLSQSSGYLSRLLSEKNSIDSCPKD